MAQIDYTQKPKRPLGVSIAIIASILIFTILPILEIVLLISIDNLMTFDSVGRSGLNVNDQTGTLPQQMIAQVALAVGFFVIAVIAWFGRPRQIRFILSLAVAFEAFLTIGLQILPRLAEAPTVLDSSRDVNQQILIFYLIMTILITTYVIWFFNRWAARAYYRGYYLPEDIEEMKRIEEEMMKSSEVRAEPTT